MDFPVLWSLAHPPAAQGSCKGAAGPACVDRRRSAVGSAFKAPGRCAGRFSLRRWDCAACCRGYCVPAFPEERSVARPGRRQAGARRSAPPKQRRVRRRGDVVPVLARTVREVEAAARSGRVTPAVRTKFQAAALLLRDERARVRAAASTSRTVRASTGTTSPRWWTRCCFRGALRRALVWRWPGRATDFSSGMPGHGGHGSMPLSPTAGARNSQAKGLML